MYAPQAIEAAASSQSYQGTPAALGLEAAYRRKPIAPPHATWTARNMSGSSE